MKTTKNITVPAIQSLICDKCGKETDIDDLECQEYVSINHNCGYSSIIGDMKKVEIDLCQHCFIKLIGQDLINKCTKD